jgi:PAS domain S-box-containing protein
LAHGKKKREIILSFSDQERKDASVTMASQSSARSDSSTRIDSEEILGQLASAFMCIQRPGRLGRVSSALSSFEPAVPEPESMYRALVEQIPAVIFIAYIDKGTSEAYVSPQIEAALGFSQEEWLDDPIRWYRHIHPEDKERWSIEAAQMLSTGNPLKSSYRVLTRNAKVLWFRCEAKMVQHADGRPWFLLGVGFDITELKRTEEALQRRTEALRNLSTHLMELQDKERRKVARDLHDGIGQYLVALKVNFDLLAASVPPGNELWEESAKLLEQCVMETRSLSYLLHLPMLEENGLASTIQWYIEGFTQRSGLDVKVNLPANLPRLSSSMEIAVYRVLQESLTNVLRHSGSKVVEISLGNGNKEIFLEVKDRGRGIPQDVLKQFRETGARVGVGLAGMRERITEIGGKFEVNSDEKGTLIRLTLPLIDAAGEIRK